MAVRRLRKRFVAGGVALVLLVGAGWFVQHQRVYDAQKLVAVEQAQTNRLSSQTKTLDHDQDVRHRRRRPGGDREHDDGPRDLLLQGPHGDPGGQPVRHQPAVDQRDAGAGRRQCRGGCAAPAAGAPAAAGASVCPGPDPFQTETIIGCVTLSGTAVSRAQVGELVTNLGSMGLFVEPFISTTTTGDSASVTFSGSVGLSEKVYSRRYAPAPATTTDPAAPSAAAPTDQTTPAGGTS